MNDTRHASVEVAVVGVISGRRKGELKTLPGSDGAAVEGAAIRGHRMRIFVIVQEHDRLTRQDRQTPGRKRSPGHANGSVDGKGVSSC